jgi:hypothetical protein
MFGDFEKFEPIREIPPNETGFFGVPRFMNKKPKIIAAKLNINPVLAYDYEEDKWEAIANYDDGIRYLSRYTITDSQDKYLIAITHLSEMWLMVWDLETNKILADMEYWTNDIVVTPDDKYIITMGWEEITKLKAPWTDVGVKDPAGSTANVYYSKGLLSLEYEILSPGEIEIDLYETSGKHICNIFHGHREPGMFHLKHPVDLPSGTYIISIRNNASISTKLFINVE